MLLRATFPPRTGWIGEAIITLEPLVCSDGRPVLLIDDKAVSSATAELAGYQILDATAAELELLHRGGYHFDLELA